MTNKVLFTPMLEWHNKTMVMMTVLLDSPNINEKDNATVCTKEATNVPEHWLIILFVNHYYTEGFEYHTINFHPVGSIERRTYFWTYRRFIVKL